MILREAIEFNNKCFFLWNCFVRWKAVWKSIIYQKRNDQRKFFSENLSVLVHRGCPKLGLTNLFKPCSSGGRCSNCCGRRCSGLQTRWNDMASTIPRVSLRNLMRMITWIWKWMGVFHGCLLLCYKNTMIRQYLLINWMPALKRGHRHHHTILKLQITIQMTWPHLRWLITHIARYSWERLCWTRSLG